MNWRRLLLPSLVLAGLIFLNLRNQCRPGWCGEYGFPVVYRSWSDEIPDFNGAVSGARFSKGALAADVLLGLALVAASFAASSVLLRKRSHTAA